MAGLFERMGLVRTEYEGTVGNGNTKMVADPGSADAYLNRRTDVFFKIIEE